MGRHGDVPVVVTASNHLFCERTAHHLISNLDDISNRFQQPAEEEIFLKMEVPQELVGDFENIVAFEYKEADLTSCSFVLLCLLSFKPHFPGQNPVCLAAKERVSYETFIGATRREVDAGEAGLHQNSDLFHWQGR